MTDVGGVSDLFEHGNNALLVPPDDPTAMAHAILHLLTMVNFGDIVFKMHSRWQETKTCDVFISEMVNRLAQNSRDKQIPISLIFNQKLM